jgi:hypothetical protein
MFLRNTEADEQIDLSTIEPFVWTVNGMPVRLVTYSRNRIEIEWFTQEQLDRLRTDYWEGLE